ncbi:MULTISPECIES: hypothetical protein [unclassified Aeromicrobium]|uniref:hypothetical protein n=1 Tax=unclassified Aeromicrobium TaxID=2633570 RepID=UPI00396B2510
MEISASVRTATLQWAFAVAQVVLCVVAVVLATQGHALWGIGVMAVVVGSSLLPDPGDDALARWFHVVRAAVVLGVVSASFLDASRLLEVLLVCMVAVCLLEASVLGWLRRRRA